MLTRARRDPTAAIEVIAAYTLINAISMIVTPDLFDKSPACVFLLAGPVSQETWAALMVLISVLLFSVTVAKSTAWRATVSACSAGVWGWFGTLLFRGSYAMKIWMPPAATFDIIAALFCLISVWLWPWQRPPSVITRPEIKHDF